MTFHRVHPAPHQNAVRPAPPSPLHRLPPSDRCSGKASPTWGQPRANSALPGRVLGTGETWRVRSEGQRSLLWAGKGTVSQSSRSSSANPHGNAMRAGGRPETSMPSVLTRQGLKPSSRPWWPELSAWWPLTHSGRPRHLAETQWENGKCVDLDTRHPGVFQTLSLSPVVGFRRNSEPLCASVSPRVIQGGRVLSQIMLLLSQDPPVAPISLGLQPKSPQQLTRH